MTPIYEQGQGQGIGYSLETFLKRFNEICQEHLQSKRAIAFAFIFYDFDNRHFRKILKNQGVFAQLDRLAGKQLSIFYLHTKNAQTAEDFNKIFLLKLGISDPLHLPSVVFFKVNNGKATDILLAELNSANSIHGFKELSDVIEDYINSKSQKNRNTIRFVNCLRSIGIDVLESLLADALKNCF